MYEHIVDSLNEAETASTGKDRCKRRKSEPVVETMENGGHINWTKHLESDQNLAGFRSQVSNIDQSVHIDIKEKGQRQIGDIECC